jgi:carboxylesterase type B
MLPIYIGLIGLVGANTPIIIPNQGPATGVKVPADMSLNQPLKQDVTNYLGIPFAYPPINELRFAPPKKYVETWTEPRAFTTYAKDCMAGAKGSEDCLYLNVYVPASASRSNPVPVMFYIYGGGFTFGRVRMYDGTALAAQEDVIVVTVSYRFGPLGFLANKATLDAYGTTGNWGILDQRMALQWVNDNIAAFGGDVSRITLFGESAGGISVATHMTSPGSQKLFKNAIIQSGVLDLDLFFLQQEDSFKFYDWLATNMTHCSSGEDMDCLRRIPATRFAIPEYVRDDSVKAPTWAASLFPFFSFGLTIDNSVVFGSPLDQALKGNVADANLIIGLTQDEGSVFALAAPTIVRPKPNVPPTEQDVLNTMEYFMGNREFVEERFNEEFHHYRARFPDVKSQSGQKVWHDDKRAKVAAYRAANVDPTKYVDVDAVVARKQQEDAENPIYGDDVGKQIMRNFAREFFCRDLASEKFNDIVQVSPEVALLYDGLKGEEGASKLPMYDKAPFAYLTSSARDIIFSCPSLQFAAALRDLGKKVFFYNLEFDVWKGTIFYNVAMKDATGKAGGDIAIADLGVFHGADIPLVFKLFKSKATHPADINLFGLFNLFTGNQISKQGDAAHKVADAIGCYWSNLAKCGDTDCGANSCHGQALPRWSPVQPGSHKYMNFGPNGELDVLEHTQMGFAGVGAHLPSNDQCRAWDQADFKYLDIKYHNNKQRARHDM